MSNTLTVWQGSCSHKDVYHTNENGLTTAKLSASPEPAALPFPKSPTYIAVGIDYIVENSKEIARKNNGVKPYTESRLHSEDGL